MKRPTAATVFGILNIIFGAFGLVCSPLFFLLSNRLEGVGKPGLDLLNQNPAYRNWLMISTGLSMAAGLVLLISGIGLLRVKPWARVLSILYAIYAMVMGVVSMVVTYNVMLAPMMKAGKSPEVVAGAVGGMIGGCVGLAYPILLLIFMFTTPVKRAFGAGGAPPESMYPEEPPWPSRP